MRLFATPFTFLVLSALPLALSGETPTTGITLPDVTVADSDDATALETNPSGLAWMSGFEVGYGRTAPGADHEGVVEDSHAVFVAAGNGSFGGGIAAQWVQAPSLGGEFQNYRKFTLGLAGSLGETVTVGTGFHLFGSSQSERLDDLASIELGLQWRPSSHLGIGLRLRDLNEPFLSPDDPLRFSTRAGATLRIFDGRLSLGTDCGVTRTQDTISLIPRVHIEPIDGVKLFGRSTFDIVGVSDHATVEDPTWTLGVEISLGSVGGQYAARGVNDEQPHSLASYHWVSPGKDRSLFMPGERWIHIDLDATFSELPSAGFLQTAPRSFLDLIRYLAQISDNPDVSGVVFVGGSNSFGYGQAWEIRNLIRRMRETGKTTVSIVRSSSLKQLYLSSAAEHIWAPPNLLVAPGGLQSRFLSIQKSLDMIGVEAEFVRIGDHKTYPEMFVRENASEANLQQRTDMLDTYYGEVMNAIASDRGIDLNEFTALVETGLTLPADAKNRGIIDKFVYADEIEDALRADFGSQVNLEIAFGETVPRQERWNRPPVVAVVAIEGMIIEGESQRTPLLGNVTSGSTTIVRSLEALAEDSSVRAVVIRVDSPGGSASASDHVYRAIRRLAKVKPVVASMGNVATSGGYYVAAGAETIFAYPTTVTGSIGIFTGKFNLTELIERFGISTSKLTRGKPGVLSDLFVPWSEEERTQVGRSIHYLYRLFLKQVADTRKKTPDDIDRLGRGRVWMGLAAQGNGLVDHIGGLGAAIQFAAQSAGMETNTPMKVELQPSSVGSSLGLGPALRGALGDAATETGGSRWLKPGTLGHVMAQHLDSALMLPLFFQAGEPMMLPFFPIAIE